MENYKDKVTFEMSGPPPKYLWSYKADFESDMSRWGYKHTTLTKNTDMLIVEYKGQGTLKEKKAERYGIPIFSYKELYDKKEKLYTVTMRKKRMDNIMKKLGEK